MDWNFALQTFFIGRFLGVENIGDPKDYLPVWDPEQIGQDPEEIMAFFQAMKKKTEDDD